MTLRDTGKTTQTPSDYNGSAIYGGCVSQRACRSCGAIVSDSICMCVGAFTCPRCGYENVGWLGNARPLQDMGLGLPDLSDQVQFFGDGVSGN